MNTLPQTPDPTPDALLEELASSSDDREIRQHIGPERAALIVRIKQKNPDVTHAEIARVIGCDRSVVTRWLQVLGTDTVKESRQLAKSQSLKATMKLADQIEHTDPRVSQGAAKAITALAGVQEGSAPVQVGVQVIVGTSSAPAGPDPFETVITSKPVSD